MSSFEQQTELLRGGVDTMSVLGLLAIFMEWLPHLSIVLIFLVTLMRLVNEIGRWKDARRIRNDAEKPTDTDKG